MTDEYYDDPGYDLMVGEIELTLEDGDSYENIARAFEIPVEAIAEINPEVNIAQETTPGRTIRLPYRVCPGGTIYIVRRGDTLASIAGRYGTTEAALRRANPFLDGIKLRPGLPVCIPPRRPVSCPGGFFYTVVSGDTLYAIASRYGTTVEAILRANPGLDPNRLYVGQRICIPRAVAPPPGPGRCPGGVFYTIAAGDTLYGLAGRYNTTVEAIIRANPGIDPNRLYIGQRICIPETGAPPGPGRCPGGFYHTIVAGDTLYSIAIRYNTTVEAIIRANPGIDPNRLYIGQRICIPGRRGPRAAGFPEQMDCYENDYYPEGIY